jgi:ketosteroid isomerase-like protein
MLRLPLTRLSAVTVLRCLAADTPQQTLRSLRNTACAMSEKLAVVRRWVELYNERTDVTEFLSLLDPDVELQTPGGPRLRGHDQARDWFEKEFENVRSRIIPDRFVEEGDVVARPWENRGAVARLR